MKKYDLDQSVWRRIPSVFYPGDVIKGPFDRALVCRLAGTAALHVAQSMPIETALRQEDVHDEEA